MLPETVGILPSNKALIRGLEIDEIRIIVGLGQMYS
jgi:hypothetical protein